MTFGKSECNAGVTMDLQMQIYCNRFIICANYAGVLLEQRGHNDKTLFGKL